MMDDPAVNEEVERIAARAVAPLGGGIRQLWAAVRGLEAKLAQKADRPAVEVMSEDEVQKARVRAAILARYSLSDQANVTRRGARPGASQEDLEALERMDTFIEGLLRRDRGDG